MVRETGEVAVRCPNRSCPAQLVESIKHFVSKGAMDIDGLGERLVEDLFAEELVRNVADLYELRRDDLVALDGFAVDRKTGAAKRADRVLASIDESRERPFARLLFALGIRHVGAVTAQALVRRFPSIDELFLAEAGALADVEGVGPVVAEGVLQYFADERNRETIAKLKAAGVRLAEERVDRPAGPLDGLAFVLTGKLPNLTRSQAQELVEAAGGKVSGSVGKSTDYVLAGEDPGSKYDRAKELGVAILDEAGLRELLWPALVDEAGRLSLEQPAGESANGTEWRAKRI